MTMFNITDGKNNISRDKPVEHIDLVVPNLSPPWVFTEPEDQGWSYRFPGRPHRFLLFDF